MFLYKHMLALKLKFGYQSYISRKTHGLLSPLFEMDNHDIPVAEDELCDFEEVLTEFQ